MTELTRSGAQKLMLVAGVVLAGLPIAFGSARAATTGTDFRYLWTAIVALASALAITARGRAGHRNTARVFLALCASTLLGALTAFTVGARSPGAVLVVTLAFGGCEAVGSGLVVWSRASAR